MKRHKAVTPLSILAIFFCLTVAAGAAHATSLSSADWKAPGDGLLTFDSRTNLQWLDISETLGMSAAQVAGELTESGRLAGFSTVSPTDVIALLTEFLGFPLPGDRSVVPYTLLYEFGMLVGVPATTGTSDFIFYGATNELNPDGSLWASGMAAIEGFGGLIDIAGSIGESFQLLERDPRLGTWLVRSGDPVPTPEPSTFVLLGLGFAGLAGMRWRKSRTQ